MPGQHAYKSLDVYDLSKKLVVACYALTHDLPAEEKTSLSHFIKTAALSAYVNITQGAFLKNKKQKKKFIRKAQTALVVIDAATEVLVEVHLATEKQATEVVQLSSSCYQLLNDLKKDK